MTGNMLKDANKKAKSNHPGPFVGLELWQGTFCHVNLLVHVRLHLLFALACLCLFFVESLCLIVDWFANDILLQRKSCAK